MSETKTTSQYSKILLTDISHAEVQAYMMMTNGIFTNDPDEMEKHIGDFLKLADEVRRVRNARI